MGFRPLQKRFVVWAAASVLILVVGLFAMGFVGTGRKTRDADYRSAVGAQEPRKHISIDGISIASQIRGGAARSHLLARHRAWRAGL